MKRYLFIFLCCLPLVGSGQIIETVAGNDTNNSTGNGGPALSASIGVGAWCIFDKDGNLYFTELSKHGVRRISNSGIINKVAGTGNAGYNGDNIAADTAKLNNPKQLATDRLGNIYIADYANHRIRKIDVTTGLVTTFAGTGFLGYSGDGDSAVHAELNYPFGICFDPTGNLYISDYGNSVIRKVDTSGIISLFAGTPNTPGDTGDNGPALSATFSNLATLCSDTVGNIYVLAGNIRKIAAVTGITTTVAGNSTFGYNGDNIAAVAAALNGPLAITVDRGNDLIIADKANNRIRKVDASGLITTIVGTGNMGFSGDGGPALNANINWPEGIAYDSCGNLFINDMQNYRIRKVSFNPNCWPLNINSPTPLNFTLSPNPATSQLTINSNTKLKHITITNALGIVVRRSSFVKTTAGEADKLAIDMSGWSTGIYFVRVEDVNGAVRVEKIIKQ